MGIGSKSRASHNPAMAVPVSSHSVPRSNDASLPSHSAREGAAAPDESLWTKLGRYSLIFTIALALVGVAMGVGLSRWKPAGGDLKDVLLQWLGLPGDVFIRTLKAITLPLVFVNVSVAITDMMNVGRVSLVGCSTVWLYMGTTVLAAGFGFCSILAFSPFILPQDDLLPRAKGEISLGCSTEGTFVTEHADGSVSCASADGLTQGSNTFIVNDLNGTFEKVISGAPDDISVSDTLYDGIFTKLFTNNLFKAFVSANFPAIVLFAITFATSISRVQRTFSRREKFGHILLIMKELNVIFLFLLDSIISFTPIAVFSMIVKAFGAQDESSDTFARAGYLIIAALMGMVLHFLVVHVGISALVRRQNPLNFLSYLVPAQTMAFASASSAATIPMTLKCITDSGMIPAPIFNLVVPLGATINMDGSAIYLPCACIWLAGVNGEKLNASACLLLVLISTIGSVGTAPVPHASLAVILTAYNTVFNKSGTPAGFELLVGIDWLMDRFQTALNVTGDAVVASFVAYICPEPFVKLPLQHDVELADAPPSRQSFTDIHLQRLGRS